MGAAPTPKIPNASSNPPRANSLLYGRYSVRYRADALPGFKTAWLLWPDSGVWPRDGEVDFPEGDLAKIIYGAVHYDRNGRDAFEKLDSDQYVTSWHVATMEWSPGRVEFFLDGRSLGVSTRRPTTPMHLILQTESCLTGARPRRPRATSPWTGSASGCRPEALGRVRRLTGGLPAPARMLRRITCGGG